MISLDYIVIPRRGFPSLPVQLFASHHTDLIAKSSCDCVWSTLTYHVLEPGQAKPEEYLNQIAHSLATEQNKKVHINISTKWIYPN